MRIVENEWFIQAPWGRICIVAWGNCLDPPVLILHGACDSLASFRPLISLLPTNFYYVGMELPGQGRSDHFPPGLSLSLMDLAHCIEIVRRHFRWEQFMYLAHSVSGTIGRIYNLAHPGRFIAAVELDQLTPRLGYPLEEISVWYTFFYTRHYSRWNSNKAPKEKKPKYTWEQAIEKVIKKRPELTPEFARATIERWSEPAGNNFIRFTSDPRWTAQLFFRPPFTREQTKALYISLRTPTLGIVTEESINIGYYKNTPFLLEDHGNYKVRRVKGGHDVHVAYPERVAPFVSQFLLYGLEGLDRKANL